MRKRGRKLIKYLEAMKCVALNNLQNISRPPIGKITIASNNNSFFLDFNRKRARIIRIGATISRGG